MKDYVDIEKLMDAIHYKYKDVEDGKFKDVIRSLESIDKDSLKKILEFYIFMQYKRSAKDLPNIRNLSIKHTGKEQLSDFLLSKKFADFFNDESEEFKESFKKMRKSNVFFNFFEVCFKELKKSNVEKVKECFEEVDVIDLSNLKALLPDKLDYQDARDLFEILRGLSVYNVANKDNLIARDVFKEMMTNEIWLDLFVANDLHVVNKFFNNMSNYSYNLVNFLSFACKNDMSPELLESFLSKYKEKINDASYENKRDIVFLIENTIERLNRSFNIPDYYNSSPALDEVIGAEHYKNHELLKEFFKIVNFDNVGLNVEVLKSEKSIDDGYYGFSLNSKDLCLVTMINRKNSNLLKSEIFNDIRKEWKHSYNVRDNHIFDISNREIQNFKEKFVSDIVKELRVHNITAYVVNSDSEDESYFQIKKDDVKIYSQDEIKNVLKKIMIQCLHMQAILNDLSLDIHKDYSKDDYQEILSNNVAKFIMKKDVDEVKNKKSEVKRVKKF